MDNKRIAKRYKNQCKDHHRNISLDLHHVLFKAMRLTLPGIPYLCMQVPRKHYNSIETNYTNFASMNNYINTLMVFIIEEFQNTDNRYSIIYIALTNLVGTAQTSDN